MTKSYYAKDHFRSIETFCASCGCDNGRHPNQVETCKLLMRALNALGSIAKMQKQKRASTFAGNILAQLNKQLYNV